MRVLALTTVLLSACGADDTARARIDLAALWQRAGQTTAAVYVRVFDATGLQNSAYLTDLNDVAELDVIAGSLRFEIEAVTAADVPTHFGEAAQTIAPGEAIVDVRVPVFPAGGVNGVVTVTDGTPIPAGTVLAASADDGRLDPDATNDRDFALTQGQFTGTLLDGSYTLTVAFVDGTTPYSGSTQVMVVQGEMVSDVTIQVGP